MTARSIVARSRVFTLVDRWLIVSLGMLLGLFASACEAPTPRLASAPAHVSGSADAAHAPSQEYRS